LVYLKGGIIITQSSLIEIISANPGIHQDKLPKLANLNKGSVYRAMRGLEKWGRVRRVKAGYGTFACYLVV